MRRLLFGAGAAATAAVGLGMVTRSEGVMGAGGVECGSVLFVSAYYSGCQPWLDDMSRVVFALVAVSLMLLFVAIARERRWGTIAWTAASISGLAVALLAPRLWREAVFLSAGY